MPRGVYIHTKEQFVHIWEARRENGTDKMPEEAKEKIRKTRIGTKNYWPNWNANLTKETDERIAKAGENVSKSLLDYYETHSHFSKGKTYEEIYGEEKAKELREKRKIARLGKTFEEVFGERAESIISKIRNKNIEYCSNEEVREFKRTNARKHALKRHQCPAIGKNETQLLNEREIKDNCKIIRQYKLYKIGYAVDGYCLETNTVYEVYEKRHFKRSFIKKDLQRQKEIEDFLKCKFIIIEDK